jgi:hypothetical protein
MVAGGCSLAIAEEIRRLISDLVKGVSGIPVRAVQRDGPGFDPEKDLEM